MFCTKCGKEINDQAAICVHCGCLAEDANQGGYTPVSGVPAGIETGEKATLATCSMVGAFLAPIVGLVLGIIGTVKYQNATYKKLSIAAIPLSIVAWVVYYGILTLMMY